MQLQIDPNSLPGYSFNSGRLKFQNRLVLGLDSDLRRKFLEEFHSSPIGGHSGIRGTYERINQSF